MIDIQTSQTNLKKIKYDELTSWLFARNQCRPGHSQFCPSSRLSTENVIKIRNHTLTLSSFSLLLKGVNSHECSYTNHFHFSKAHSCYCMRQVMHDVQFHSFSHLYFWKCPFDGKIWMKNIFAFWVLCREEDLIVILAIKTFMIISAKCQVIITVVMIGEANVI